jgi:orotidine-5'-phosphate decarboxylase
MTAPQTDTKPTTQPAERLIVALDVENAARARSVVRELDGLVTTFKIGLQLFAAEGPRLVEEIAALGKRVFLDLKFHDIPNTAAKAGIEAARLGVWMFNVHAGGGGEMMRAVRAEVDEFCDSGNRSRPLIIGVTVLTSSDVNTLRETGAEPDVEAQVERLARLTAGSGLDGVVASANEIEIIRRSVADPRFVIVTPGIRPLNATKGDQKRVMTPGAAILAGADHLVVGRPILEAADRADAASKILDEIAEVI